MMHAVPLLTRGDLPDSDHIPGCNLSSKPQRKVQRVALFQVDVLAALIQRMPTTVDLSHECARNGCLARQDIVVIVVFCP